VRRERPMSVPDGNVRVHGGQCGSVSSRVNLDACVLDDDDDDGTADPIFEGCSQTTRPDQTTLGSCDLSQASRDDSQPRGST
jgi:hypothetical protein